jgi:hypothetical protein
MAVYFEGRPARDADQRYPACLGRPHRKSSRCRNGDQYTGSDECRFLNHLHGYPAGKNDGNLCAGKSGSQFVERIVPADILTGEDKATVRLVEPSSMGGACCPIEGLGASERFDRMFDVAWSEGNRAGQFRARSHGFAQALDSAKTASGRTR